MGSDSKEENGWERKWKKKDENERNGEGFRSEKPLPCGTGGEGGGGGSGGVWPNFPDPVDCSGLGNVPSYFQFIKEKGGATKDLHFSMKVCLLDTTFRNGRSLSSPSHDQINRRATQKLSAVTVDAPVPLKGKIEILQGSLARWISSRQMGLAACRRICRKVCSRWAALGLARPRSAVPMAACWASLQLSNQCTNDSKFSTPPQLESMAGTWCGVVIDINMLSIDPYLWTNKHNISIINEDKPLEKETKCQPQFDLLTRLWTRIPNKVALLYL